MNAASLAKAAVAGLVVSVTKISSVSFVLNPSSARDVWLQGDASGAWHRCERRLTRFVCELSSPIDATDATPVTVTAHA